MREIEKRGIKNKKRKFNTKMLRAYLTNLKLIGKVERNKENKDKSDKYLMPYEKYELVELDYGTVIDVKLWGKAQAILKRNSERLRKNTKLKKVYLLSGILRMKDSSTFCGTGANGQGGRKNYYYNKAHNLRIEAEMVEEAAFKAASELIKDSQRLQLAIKKYATSDERVNSIKSQVQRIKDEIDGYLLEKKKATARLDLLIESGSREKAKLYISEFESQMEVLDANIAKKEAQLNTIERCSVGEVEEFLERLKDGIDIAGKVKKLAKNGVEPVMLKAALSKLFDAVVVSVNKEEGTYDLDFVIGDEWQNEPDKSGEKSDIECVGDIGGNRSFTGKMVPRAGLEPAWYCYRRILSPVRLPISPPGHINFHNIAIK